MPLLGLRVSNMPSPEPQPVLTHDKTTSECVYILSFYIFISTTTLREGHFDMRTP